MKYLWPAKGEAVFYHHVEKALSSLPAYLKAETLLLTIGNNSEGIAETVGMQTLNLGDISSDLA